MTRNSISPVVSLSSIGILYRYSWRSFFKILCNGTCERPNSWERLQRDFFRLLLTEECLIHIIRISCSQLPARSGIFCHLVEVVYGPCGLKFMYAMINLFFGGIIFKLKKLNIQRNFVCTVLNDFVSKQVVMQDIFPLLSKNFDQGLIVVIVYYFQIWNKKELAQSVVSADYTNCISAERSDSPNECPVMTLNNLDGEIPATLELWGMWSTPSLSLLPSPLGFGVVAPNRVLSISQIELNCTYAKRNCLK